jgi:hypothetical protein
MVTQGIYEHYKSTPEDRKYYQVLLLSHDEETQETLVHYQPLYFLKDDAIYNDGITVWTRTLKNFEETVRHNGKTIPRFTLISSTIEK